MANYIGSSLDLPAYLENIRGKEGAYGKQEKGKRAGYSNGGGDLLRETVG